MRSGIHPGHISPKGSVAGFFSNSAEDDYEGMHVEPPVIAADNDDVDADGAFDPGNDYQLSFAYYKNAGAHEKSYYFTSPLGDPFPS